MADLEQLKQKYKPVIDTINEFSQYGAKVDTVEMPSQVVANRVWDAIKRCDPAYADLQHEIVTTGGAEQPYTIKAGDNLSKISKLFYGNPNKYEAIAKANGLENPDKIRVGQEIKLPVLS